MGTGLKICRTRTACAVLASGVVISLTALTGGVAPAFAKPGDEPVVPTTTVIAPEPEVVPTKQEEPAEAPTAAQVPAPSAPTTAVVPAVPAPVQEQPAVEAPPKTRTPRLDPTVDVPAVVAPTVETPSQTRAPAPAPSTSNPPATREVAPPPTTRTTVTETTQTPASQAPAKQTPPSQAPSSEASAPSTASGSPTSSETSTPPSPGLVAPTPATGETSTEQSAASSAKSSESSESSESSKSSESSAASSTPAAERVIEKVQPQTLVAPEEDVQIAKSAKIIEEKPIAAPKTDIEDITKVIDVRTLDRDRFNQNGLRDDDRVRLAGDRGWDRNVRQWRPDWVEYDQYYRPILSNPYRDPVRIVYIYQNAPRIVWIPPLARIVLEVAQFAAYSFTAVVTNTINQAVNVAVGSFFGGGFFPGIGLPLPPPPPPLLNFANVPVQVRYSDATYEPFRVQKIVDVGDDPRYGERKVLLDGVTPAWGRWTQTPSGERSFEVHKTQQFPGLDDPREAPLPGDYQLRLAADESSSGMSRRDAYLVAVAIACGVLSLGAVLLAVLLGRRRRPQH